MERKSEPTKYVRQATFRINSIIAEYCDGNQQIFVDKTGINKGSVSQYVNGKNVPSTKTAKIIADVFHVNPAWVMGFDVSKEPDPPAASVSLTLTEEETRIILRYRQMSEAEKNLVCNMMQIKRDEEFPSTRIEKLG